jgi:hypothetical protein
MDATPPPASGPASDVLGSAAIAKPSPQKSDTSDASNSGGAADKDEESGSSNDVQDDTLTRMSTKETLAAGSMGRDEGQLTRKTRRRERVSEVESVKQLETSGTDPKFQGSLLHSSVTSIEDLGVKGSDDAQNKADQEPVTEDEARFKARRLVFSQETADASKEKKTKSHTKAETSPTPSPSATAATSKR